MRYQTQVILRANRPKESFRSSALPALPAGRLRMTVFLVVFIFTVNGFALASEVIPESTDTQVIVRNHPKTGKPYVSIVSAGTQLPANPFTGQPEQAFRPDYQMLDPKNRRKIAYEGPSSDRTKVYVFAGSLAAVGIAGGAIGLAAAPAATGAGAAGGAGALAAAGTTVAVGTLATGLIKLQPRPFEHLEHDSQTRLIESADPSESVSGSENI